MNQGRVRHRGRVKRSLMLGLFDHLAKRQRSMLVSHFGDQVARKIEQEARAEFAALIPGLPWVGNVFTTYFLFIIEIFLSAVVLAYYRVLRRYFDSYDRIKTFQLRMVETLFSSFPATVSRFIGRVHFMRSTWWLLKLFSKKSQQRRYPGNFVFSFIEGNGVDFDFGVDFQECAICKFYQSQGAPEATDICCASDYPMARIWNTGFRRTTTLAEGAARCDFRYKRPTTACA